MSRIWPSANFVKYSNENAKRKVVTKVDNQWLDCELSRHRKLGFPKLESRSPYVAAAIERE